MTDYVLYSRIVRAKELDPTITEVRTRYRDVIEDMSNKLEMWTNRRFDHRITTIAHSALSLGKHGHVCDDELFLREELQQVISIENGDGVALSPEDYEVIYEERGGRYISRIALLPTSNTRWTAGDRRPQTAIRVTGVWGYGGTWYKSGVTLGAALDDSDDEITLSAQAGTVFEARQILRLDDEYLLVTTDPATSSTTLTVERAVNGSEAAAHNDEAVIYIYKPLPFVENVAKRLVLWAAELEPSPVFGTIAVGDFQAAVDLSQVPKDIAGDILKLRIERTEIYGTGSAS